MAQRRFRPINYPAGGSTAWGDITGTLSDQTDLQTQLDLKLEDAPSDGSTYGRLNGSWSVVPSGGLSNIVEDTTPQLGGDLDANGFDVDITDGKQLYLESADTFSNIYFYMDNITGAQYVSSGAHTFQGGISQFNFRSPAYTGDAQLRVSGDDVNKLTSYEWDQMNCTGSTSTDYAFVGFTGVNIGADLDVTGLITLTGTVDGRDVAADGTKLDGIESGATADQTAAEIRTLVEAATDSNVFTDADHSKLNGIEASATADQTITAGEGLSGGGTGDVSLAVDMTEFATETTIASGDFIAMIDITDSGNGKIQFANFETALNHDNLTGFVSNEHIDWTNASSNFLTTGTISNDEIATQTPTTGGNTSGLQIDDHNGTLRDAGFNDATSVTLSADLTLAEEHVGNMLSKSAATIGIDIILPSSTTAFPVGSMVHFLNHGNSTVLINAASQTRTLYWLDGTTRAGGASTNRTIAYGGAVTIWRGSATEYFIWGAGIS